MRLREQRSLQPLLKVRHEESLETPVLSIKDRGNKTYAVFIRNFKLFGLNCFIAKPLFEKKLLAELRSI